MQYHPFTGGQLESGSAVGSSKSQAVLKRSRARQCMPLCRACYGSIWMRLAELQASASQE